MMDSLDDGITLSMLMKRNSEKTSEQKKNESLKASSLSWVKEKEVYELQLNQLQEQLVASMLQNQNYENEIKKLKVETDFETIEDLKRQLKEEKDKHKKDEEFKNTLLEKNKDELNTSKAGDFCEISTEHVIVHRESSVNHSDSEPDRKTRFAKRLFDLKISIWNFIHERLSDFVNDEDLAVPEEEEEQLSVRRLKENMSRFSAAISPIKRFYGVCSDLFAWRNPWFTLTIFLVYFYALWVEMIIPLLVLLILIQLTLNFLHTRGFHILSDNKRKNSDSEEVKEDQASLSERYQLVLQIAKKVQNTLGSFADSLEKIESLFLWEQMEATKTIYYSLWVIFVASCILPTNTFLLFLGMFFGVKMFLITPIYVRFPKVQNRYDDLNRMWKKLPTHHEKEKIAENVDKSSQNLSETNPATPVSGTIVNNTNRPLSRSNEKLEDSSSSWENIVFSDRFQLPSLEVPLHDWIDGRRCTLMDKDSPLSSMKHGRLYLTPNYICFERNQFHTKKNISIKLSDIVAVKKTKPISFIPGPGMAIELEVTNISKPYVFAAMMGRDEAFDSIMRAARLLKLPWSL
ncbi:GRAM domain-containing protein 4 isoform X1 [Hydra vulgaris]|uniref:GRAM domain-containing protein 4 isoform X1 n=1 Tax=Hydra vulgaris TaxID=6087 RepID=UPI001F5FBDBC|nr:GRAM domain-containing protein 4 [Hydra vulgaris]